jgi:hypothetical protein
MSKQPYHSPEFHIYGSIKKLTETMGEGAAMDNPGKDAGKSSF